VQAERDPKCRTEARCEVQQPGCLEQCEPGPSGRDADADGEGPDHPPTVMHDVVAPDGPDRKHQSRKEPQAEHHRGRCLRQSAERDWLPKIKAKTR
jgi:hypothetical protein